MYDVVVKSSHSVAHLLMSFSPLNRENYVRGKIQCFTDMCIHRLKTTEIHTCTLMSLNLVVREKLRLHQALDSSFRRLITVTRQLADMPTRGLESLDNLQMPPGGHVGATWRIRLNHPSGAAMRSYVKVKLN